MREVLGLDGLCVRCNLQNLLRTHISNSGTSLEINKTSVFRKCTPVSRTDV